MCRQSRIKPESILVQIASQVLWRNRSLMCTQQPSLDQRDNQMNMGQQLGSLLLALGDILDNMLIVFFFQRGIAKPPISNHNAAKCDIFSNERDQVVGRSVRDYPESYSTQFLLLKLQQQ